MHELDELLKHSSLKDEVLKHYGVKGMKWRETKERVEEMTDEAGNTISEVGEEVGDSIEDFLKKATKGISKFDDNFKKAGVKALQKIFGKHKGPTIKINGVEQMRLKNGKLVPKDKKIREREAYLIKRNSHNPAGAELDRIKRMSPAEKKKIRDKWKTVPKATWRDKGKY